MEGQNCLAKALYDNTAESPDELPFKKGDVLTVLEQNTNNMEGWWLCSLRGRQGITPGNRLKILAGMYDNPKTFHSSLNQAPCVQVRRQIGNLSPNKVITPHRYGDIYLYDVPVRGQDVYDVPPLRSKTTDVTMNIFTSSLEGSLNYDTPSAKILHSGAYDIPASHPYDVPTSNILGFDSSDAYDIPLSHSSYASSSEAYDVPSSNRSSGVSMMSTGSFLSPSSSRSSLTASMSNSSLCGSNRSSLDTNIELYDIPSNDVRRVINKKDLEALPQQYDVPLMLNVPEGFYDVPGSNAPTYPTEFYDKLPRYPHPMDGVYDVPPQVTRDTAVLVTSQVTMDQLENKMNRLSTSSKSSQNQELPLIEGKELPLDLDAAMDMLVKLQQEVQSAISKLFSFVSSSWRQKEHLEPQLYDIKLACVRVRTALQEFVEFALGALVNSTKAPDTTLCHKLAKLVKPLQDSNFIIQKSCSILDESGWQVSQLAILQDSAKTDELDQLVACARGLTEDVRQTASFIQGNCTLIFKRAQQLTEADMIKQKASNYKPTTRPKPTAEQIQHMLERKNSLQERPLPVPPVILASISTDKEVLPSEENVYENDSKHWMEDYDYVNLESKEAIEKENNEIKNFLPKELSKSFDNLVKESNTPVENYNNSSNGFGVNDKQVLQFYSSQIEAHMLYLTNAIDAFLLTIENNQVPKVFIAHSKFVVLSAHKLIYIGDTIHHNVIHTELRNSIMQCANVVCNVLKATVLATKVAAQNYPSVCAVQEMVDVVVELSHAANDLKLLVFQAANL